MKYGFVYIWYDRKHSRYYIGSHWGFETDGYICSSSWMKQAYARRPRDFRRRILARIYERKLLIQEEQKWLSLICKSELGKRYYNLNNIAIKHWHIDPDITLTVSEKISKANKGKRFSPSTEFKKGVSHSPDTQFKKGHAAHNKGKTLEERYGAERAAILREKYSQAKRGKPSKSTSKFKKGHVPWNAKYSSKSLADSIEVIK